MLKTSLIWDVFNLIGIKVSTTDNPEECKESMTAKAINKKKIKVANKNVNQEQKYIDYKSKISEDDIKILKTKNLLKYKEIEEFIINTIEEDYRKGDFEKIFSISN